MLRRYSVIDVSTPTIDVSTPTIDVSTSVIDKDAYKQRICVEI